MRVGEHCYSFIADVVVEIEVVDVCIQDRADALFKQVHVSKTLKGRSNDAIGSACLYIACRQEGVPRTFKGLSLSRHFIPCVLALFMKIPIKFLLCYMWWQFSLVITVLHVATKLLNIEPG